MVWIGAIAIAIAFLFIGANIGFRLANDRAKQIMFRHDNGRAADRASFLLTISRELANQMVWKDPDSFVDFYKQLHAEISGYKSWKPDALRRKHDELAKKYPQFQDFDVIGVRRYVLTCGDNMLGEVECAEAFGDITRFIGILHATDEHWIAYRATSDEELKHLSKYAQRIKDTKFKLRLERAMEDYYLYSSVAQSREPTLDNGRYLISPIQHFAENRYGIHLKDTNEDGVYSFFVHDDGDIAYSYNRSDPSFESTEWLDVDSGVFEYFGGSERPTR